MSIESANDRGATELRLEPKHSELSDAPGTWSTMLTGMCRLMRAEIALVTTIDPSRQRVHLHGSVNIAEQDLQSYAARRGLFGGFSSLGKADSDIISTSTDGAECNAGGASEFFANWLRPQGITNAICGRLAIQEPQATYLTIGRPRKASAFDSDDIELFASLLPCIRMTFRSLRLITSAHEERQTLLSLLNRLPTGVALLNRRHEPVFINDYARHALADVGGLDTLLPLFFQRRRQDPPGAHEGRKPLAQSDAGCDIRIHVIERGAGSRPLSVIMQRLQEDDSCPDDDSPAFALIISDPNRAIELDHAALCRLYGLTPAEGRLAALLASGKHVESMANLLGVSVHTVRTHLKHIFSKTETSSQSDLVRLILSAPSPIRTA